MEANVPCPSGTEIKSQSRCQIAHDQASSLGLNPGRSLQVGSWDGVPYQCSAQVGADDALHFSTNAGTDNSRFIDGEFVMICEAGKHVVVVVCLFLLLELQLICL